MEFYLDTTITDLKEMAIISIRTFNCLRSAGLETLGSIAHYINKPYDLLKLRNFGFKSLAEIEPVLKQMTFSNSVPAPEMKREKFAKLGDKAIEIITDAYKTVIEGDTKVKGYLQSVYSHPSDLHYLVMGSLDDMLMVVEGYSREENLEIRHTYKQFIDVVLEKMESSQEAGNEVYPEYKKKGINLSYRMEYFSPEQIINYFLSPVAYEYLEEAYQEQVALYLSVRSRNFVAKYLPHFPDLIKYAEESLASYRKICPGAFMPKTLTEIFQFNQKFKREFDKVSKLTEEDFQIEQLRHDYPYLTSKQRKFMFDFTKEFNHAPMFFLLLNYLRLSANRSNKIYCLAHGVFDGKRRTLYEIADATNLSRERVRQILNRKIEAQDSLLAKSEDWVYYKKLFELPLIYEKIDEIIKLREDEHLLINFETFASLIKLVADFKIEEVDGHAILVNNKYVDFKFSDCIETLFSVINAKYSVDTYVPLDSLLYTIPEYLRPVVKNLIKYIVEELNKVQITEDERLFLPQNYIDIAEELYDILAKKGKPMHVEEIFNAFKARYPDHKYTNFVQIKSFLLRHKHIKPIGKTSCYALDNWEGIYFGSIRDLLVELLEASDVPLHIDNLYNGVSRYYPNTNKASLMTTMEDENLQRFVEFEGGFFGLTAKKYPPNYVKALSYQRYSFEERISLFKEFVDTYHRFPCSNGSENEASLMRWYYNVINNLLTITNSQRKIFDDLIKHYDELGYPRSATENEFLIKCKDVKNYIRQYHTLPTNGNAPELSAWLRRSRDNYDTFTDKRRQYMTDLLNYILSFGFSI